MYQPSPRASRIFVTGYVIKVCSTIILYVPVPSTYTGMHLEGMQHITQVHWTDDGKAWLYTYSNYSTICTDHYLAMLISIYYCATFSLNVCLCYLCTQSVSYILFIALFAKFSPSTASDCIKVKSLGTRLCSTCVYIATVFFFTNKVTTQMQTSLVLLPDHKKWTTIYNVAIRLKRSGDSCKQQTSF